MGVGIENDSQLVGVGRCAVPQVLVITIGRVYSAMRHSIAGPESDNMRHERSRLFFVNKPIVTHVYCNALVRPRLANYFYFMP